MRKLILGMVLATAFVAGIAGPTPPTASAIGAQSPAHDELAFRAGARALVEDAQSRPTAYPFPASFLQGAIERSAPVYRISGPDSPTGGVFTGLVWECDPLDPNAEPVCYAGLVEINGQKHFTDGP